MKNSLIQIKNSFFFKLTIPSYAINFVLEKINYISTFIWNDDRMLLLQFLRVYLDKLKVKRIGAVYTILLRRILILSKFIN